MKTTEEKPATKKKQKPTKKNNDLSISDYLLMGIVLLIIATVAGGAIAWLLVPKEKSNASQNIVEQAKQKKSTSEQGKNKQEAATKQKEKAAKAEEVPESFDKLKMELIVDRGVMKDNKQKYIVTITNTSEYIFKGRIEIKNPKLSWREVPFDNIVEVVN